MKHKAISSPVIHMAARHELLNAQCCMAALQAGRDGLTEDQSGQNSGITRQATMPQMMSKGTPTRTKSLNL